MLINKYSGVSRRPACLVHSVSTTFSKELHWLANILELRVDHET